MVRLRVVMCNLQYGGGARSPLGYLVPTPPGRRRANLMDMARALAPHRPDVMGMVEVASGSLRTSGRDQAREVADALSLPYVAEVCKYRPELDGVPLLGENILAMASRTPIDGIRPLKMPAGFKRMALVASVGDVALVLCHLSLARGARSRQVADLCRVVNSTESPTILMGDLNAEPGSLEIVQLMSETGLRPAVSGATYPSWNPKRALDHILTSPDIAVKRGSVLDARHSDHLPIAVDIETNNCGGTR